VLYLPAAILSLYWAWRALFVGAVAVGFLVGYALWTLVEYLGHRFLYHHRFISTAGRRAQFLMHGVHHNHPSDPLRLVMPPLMSVPIMAAAWAALRASLGPAQCLPVLAGFLAGYVAYDILHYHLHHGQPRNFIGRFLRARHMHHHFRDETTSFGVSAPWWDYVFGTQLRLAESSAAFASRHSLRVNAVRPRRFRESAQTDALRFPE
jgi:sterol desaturase/sphingolipid hydroxylase (fatty acid hydroxylase superfamily)